jgi:hypothetical protein
LAEKLHVANLQAFAIGRGAAKNPNQRCHSERSEESRSVQG